MTRVNNRGKSGNIPLFLLKKQKQKRIFLWYVFFAVFIVSVMGLLGYGIYYFKQNRSAGDTQKELQNIREEADTSTQ